MPSPTSQQQKLFALLAPVVETSGYFLDDVAISPAGRRSLVRATIDGEDGISLDAVAAVSRAISECLDAAEESGDAVLPGAYVLEVSSPGVDRPLTQARHWRRNIARLVETSAAGAPISGRIVAVSDDEDPIVTIAGAKGDQALALSQLSPGRVQVEFGRAAAGESEDDDLDDELMDDESDDSIEGEE